MNKISDTNHIRLDLIHRENDPVKEVQGITFTIDRIIFKGSQAGQEPSCKTRGFYILIFPPIQNSCFLYHYFLCFPL